MNRILFIRSSTALSLLLAILMIGCLQPSLETGYDIPGFFIGPTGMHPVYDQVQISPFRGNLSYQIPIEVTEIVLGSDRFAPHVKCRSNIETQPGQIRFNIIDIWIPGTNMESENVTLRLANIHPDITIERAIWHSADWDGHYRPALKINISSKAAPGDYKFEILAFLNGKYQGKIPFTLHVTK